jgi:hypothetical protein
MGNDGIFHFRRAHPADKGAVEALCAKIWDGDDYIPRCFDAWAADQEGELSLCFVDERLAGLSKLTWLAPGEAWLEGLRKDPDLPVRGVGRALCRRYLERLAAKEGLRSVRFSTYFQNHASIKLNEGMGFELVASASLKVLGSEAMTQRRREARAENPRVVTVRAAEVALPFLRASGWFGHYLHQAWRSYPWSEALFQERYLDAGNCLGVVEDGRLKALAAALVDPTKGEGTMPFFDAEDAASAAVLLAAVEGRLAEGGAPEANAMVPPGGARALGLLDALGWRSLERADDYLVYELSLEKLAAYRSSSSSHST